MFKKDISAGSKTKVKSSVQRSLKTKLLETYSPLLTPAILDEMIPKKSQLEIMKLPEKITLYTLPSSSSSDSSSHQQALPLFYQSHSGPLIPTLRLIHLFPQAFRSVRIDRGAIRFVLSGATLMVPGLTSPGGRLPDSEEALEEGTVVVVKAEGKEEVCMVGELKMGTEEMKVKKKGVAIEGGHFLGDGLWRLNLD